MQDIVEHEGIKYFEISPSLTFHRNEKPGVLFLCKWNGKIGLSDYKLVVMVSDEDFKAACKFLDNGVEHTSALVSEILQEV